jgi:hypothetical protein
LAIDYLKRAFLITGNKNYKSHAKKILKTINTDSRANSMYSDRLKSDGISALGVLIMTVSFPSACATPSSRSL